MPYIVTTFNEIMNEWLRYSSPMNEDIAIIHFNLQIKAGRHARITHEGVIVREG
jgi:hypothetical protein